MPYKVIVVGFDRSARGAIAVDEALRLARDTGATLHAVHVVHPSVLAGAANSHAFQAAIDGSYSFDVLITSANGARGQARLAIKVIDPDKAPPEIPFINEPAQG